MPSVQDPPGAGLLAPSWSWVVDGFDANKPTHPTDAALEERYALHAFKSSLRPVVAYCGVFMAILVMLGMAYPFFWYRIYMTLAGGGVITAARLWAWSMEDQRQARILFGRALCASMAICFVAGRVHFYLHPPQLSGEGLLFTKSLVWSISPIYLRLMGITSVHRLAFLGTLALGFLLDPAHTVLGRPIEPLCHISGLLVGDVFGYVIQRRMWFAYVHERRSAPPEQRAASKPSQKMDPNTLAFLDAALEEEYTTHAFRSAYEPIVAFCGVLIVLNVTCAIVMTVEAWILLVPIVACLLIVAARSQLHHMKNQQRARLLFGRYINCINAATWAYLLERMRRDPPELSPGGLVAVAALLWTLFPTCLRLWAFRDSHRLAYLATSMVGFIFMPSWSELGRPAEPLCFCGAALLGELLGFTLESHWRMARLQLRERELQQRQAEAQAETYRRDNEQLRQNANARDYFVASLSHEMRTPLNGALGVLQLAKLEVDSVAAEMSNDPRQTSHYLRVDKIRQYVDRALDGGLMLCDLVEDTLNMTRIEQGRFDLDIKPLSLPRLSKTCIELVRDLASPRRIVVESRIEDSIEAAGDVMGDPRRLKQVVFNLLNNAVKFTPDGGRVSLRLTTRRTPSAASLDMNLDVLPVLLTVSDTGIGIKEEDRDLVFLKYTKATESGGGSGVDRHAGAGLGLSICKAMVELHGGTISLDSVWGEGTTFSIHMDLPLATDGASSLGTAEEAAVKAAKALKGIKVLVADDIEMNRYVANETLQSFGCIVEEVADGAAAVLAVTAARKNGNPFDAVLMDVQMPALDGLEAASIIRALEEGNDHVPIIAVTGFAGPKEKERCLEHMDGYMTKPLLRTELARLLQKHVRRLEVSRLLRRSRESRDTMLLNSSLGSDVWSEQAAEAPSAEPRTVSSLERLPPQLPELEDDLSVSAPPRLARSDDDETVAHTAAATAAAAAEEAAAHAGGPRPNYDADEDGAESPDDESPPPTPLRMRRRKLSDGEVSVQGDLDAISPFSSSAPSLRESTPSTPEFMKRGYSRHAKSVEAWLTELNLGQHAALFAAASINNISELPQLTDERLMQIGVVVRGHRKRILLGATALAAAALNNGTPPSSKPPPPASPLSHQRRPHTMHASPLDSSPGSKSGGASPALFSHSPRAVTAGDAPPGPMLQPGPIAYFGTRLPSTQCAPTTSMAMDDRIDPSAFDPMELLSEVGGSEEIMRGMLKRYSAMQCLPAVDEALAASDAVRLQKAVHTIKGQLAYLRAHKAHEVARTFDEEAKRAIEDGDFERREEKLVEMRAQLVVEMERVEENRKAVLEAEPTKAQGGSASAPPQRTFQRHKRTEWVPQEGAPA